MTDRVIAWSLRNRPIVLAAGVLVLGGGALTAVRLPVDVFPDLTAPTVTVITEAHGMAPGELETLVTFPIESALNGAAGVRRVRSQSTVGISIVWVEFDWGQEIGAARQVVMEKLSLVAEALPPEVERPFLAPQSSILGEILFLAVTSDRHPAIEVREFVETVLRRRLLAVPGVSQVTPIGGAEKQYQVEVDPRALRRYQVSLAEVERAAAESNRNSSGGVVAAGGTEYLVEARGRARSADDIARAVVARRGGRQVELREVAAVRVGEALKRGEASSRGRRAVIIGIQKQPGAGTLELTRALESALDDVEKTQPEGFRIERGIFRQADFIEVAIGNVSRALVEGAVLVVAVVLLFLASPRPTLVTLAALPLSLGAALLVFGCLGISINTMTLGGFAIAIGALVDDAIVDVENVARRLRLEGTRPAGERRAAMALVFEASREIRGSIVFATLVIALVFLPLFFLGGVEGRLLRPLGIAYVVALLASLLVALTVTPALCSLLLPRSKSILSGREPRLVAALKRGYAAVLKVTLPRSGALLGVSAALVAAAALGLFLAGRSFLPEFNEGSLTINAVTLPGTSLAESDRLGHLVEEILLREPEVAKVARRTGRAERDEHAQGVEASELDVSLSMRGRSKAELLDRLRAALAQVPGVSITIGQPISHRIDHMLSGSRASIAVKVFGEHLLRLRAAGEAVRRVMEGVRGVVDLAAEPQVEVPYLRIRPDREAMARYGIRAGEAAEAVETALAGKTVSRVLEGRRGFDLVVRLAEGSRGSPEALREIPIDLPAGGQVPLRAVARIARESGPNSISRENVERKYVVTCNVAGRDLKGVVDEIRARVSAAGVIPPGYRVEYGGQFESAEAAGKLLLALGAVVVVGIFLLLQLALGSARDAALVMANLPLALVGGVAGVWLSGGVLSIAEIIGFITLFGIATRNGLMLISHVRHLQAVEGETDLERAVARGSIERLAPILMTALAAGIGLVPLALGGSAPGNEIQTPMAVVILCGLLSSTFLNMIVIPALYLRFGPRTPGPGAAAGGARDLPQAASRLGAAPGAAAMALCLALAAPGCSAIDLPLPRSTPAAQPEPRELLPPAARVLPAGPLELAQAEALALERHPRLEALAHEREAAAGRLRQAGALPNPRLHAATETNRFDDVWGSGEHVAGVLVPLPWGGRIGAARRAAELEIERRRALLAAGRREALLRVRVAFARALAADLSLEAAEEVAQSARAAAELVRRKAAEGLAREAERLRAEIEEARARAEAEGARSRRSEALSALAAAAGAGGEPIEGVRGELPVPAPPGREALAARLGDHPRLKAFETAREAARAEGLRVRAERLPDLTVGGFYRRLEAEDADGFDLNLGIDLPVFDRKRGAIEEAAALERAAEATLRVERIELERALEEALFALERSARLAAVHDGEILPRARRALEIAERGYREGALALSEAIEARRALAAARLSRIEALRECAEAWARVRWIAEDGEGR